MKNTKKKLLQAKMLLAAGVMIGSLELTGCAFDATIEKERENLYEDVKKMIILHTITLQVFTKMEMSINYFIVAILILEKNTTTTKQGKLLVNIMPAQSLMIIIKLLIVVINLSNLDY